MAKLVFESQPSFRLLTKGQIEMIHEKALYILQTTGVKFGSAEALKILEDHGAHIDGAGQIAKFPRQMVMQAINTVPDSIQLYDREGNPAVKLGGNKAHFAPGSAPMNLMESDGTTVRPAVAKDLVKISRLNDALDNIVMQSSAVVLNDVPKSIGDAYRLYLLLVNFPKPIVYGAFSVDGISYMRDMLAAVLGGREVLREKPLAVFDVCPSLPLKWTPISAQNIIDCAGFGLPLEIVSVQMSGAASPATHAGSVLLHTAETLSGLVLAQCVSPGTPVIYGGAQMHFDMRQSTTSLNSIETTMISTAYAQMGKYYGLPTHTYADLSDSKTLDTQTGLESGMSALGASLAGINVISGVGVTEFCKTFSLEKLVIDNEICGMALRMERGIDCSEESLAMDLICELCLGGDFLSAEHTFRWFKKETYFPSPVINRSSRHNWQEKGSMTSFTQAHEQVKFILKNHQPREMPTKRRKNLDMVTGKIMEDLNIRELPYGPDKS